MGWSGVHLHTQTKKHYQPHSVYPPDKERETTLCVDYSESELKNGTFNFATVALPRTLRDLFLRSLYDYGELGRSISHPCTRVKVIYRQSLSSTRCYHLLQAPHSNKNGPKGASYFTSLESVSSWLARTCPTNFARGHPQFSINAEYQVQVPLM